MKISEIFSSFQGEGSLAGTPSVFVRTSVCNLRCVWCDTRYTSWDPEWSERTVEDVASEVRALAAGGQEKIRHVVVTGGEPALEGENLSELCRILSAADFHLTVETNATLFFAAPVNLISMSPKLKNAAPPEKSGPIAASHESQRLRPDVIKSFLREYNSPPRKDCQIKFVVESESDVEEIREIASLAEIPAKKIQLMPQSIERADLEQKSAWLRPLAARLGYGFSPRLHIARFGNRRGV